MRSRDSLNIRALRLAAAVLVVAGAAGATQKTTPKQPEEVPRLRLIPNGRALVLEIRTGTPVPPYAFTIPGPESNEAQVSWQGRPEDYPRRTALGDARLPEVRIEPLGQDRLKIRVPLNDLRLVSVDQSKDGIRLHLVDKAASPSAPAPPAPGPSGKSGATGPAGSPSGGGASVSPSGGGSSGPPAGGGSSGSPGGGGSTAGGGTAGSQGGGAPSSANRRSGEYEIGAGDKLEFSVFGHDDLKRSIEVRSDGKANIPMLGDVPVAGKTTDELDEEVTLLLGRDYIVDPQVSIELKESAKLWVTVMGEVRTPGRYPLKRDMKLIDLMAAAGGITKDAGSRITIARHREEGGDVQTLAVERDRLLGDVTGESNLVLQRNDVVTIGGKDYYYIRGEVARPGPYFLESGTTVLKAISVASGLTPFANRRSVSLLRSGKDGVQEKIRVNVKSIEDGKAPDIPIKPEDTIIVPRRVF